jgi:hypothetical protein
MSIGPPASLLHINTGLSFTYKQGAVSCLGMQAALRFSEGRKQNRPEIVVSRSERMRRSVMAQRCFR